MMVRRGMKVIMAKIKVMVTGKEAKGLGLVDIHVLYVARVLARTQSCAWSVVLDAIIYALVYAI